jgi:hypothetical protein
MAAAIAAARCGARVSLIEAQPQVGGTVAGALIHTLAGLYDARGEYLNGGLAQELAERLLQASPTVHRRRMGRVFVLQVCPNLYRDVVQDWIDQEARIRVMRNARVSHIVRSADRVVEVEASVSDGTLRFRPSAVIDATGTADVVSLIDRRLCHDDSRRAAGGWVCRLRDVEHGALQFPKGVAIVRALREAAAGPLPSECGKAWLDGGIVPDEVFVKLFVPLGENWRKREIRGEISQAAQQTQNAVVNFLRGLPGFSQAKVVQTGKLGVRDGGRVHGEYTLSASDVREFRKFDDAVCRCCWPIEYWDPVDGVSLEYLPPGEYYEVPMRSLRLPGLSNVWVAGKCLSADRYAQASARMVGSCWAMGEAVGKAAAVGQVASLPFERTTNAGWQPAPR